MKCGLSRIARRYSPGVRAFGALLVVLAFVAAGCGSSEMGAADGETTAEPTPTTAIEKEDVPGRTGVGWSVVRAQEAPPEGPPTAAKLAVFAEPAKPSDSFSGSNKGLGLEGPEEVRPGRQLFTRARLLVSPEDAEGFGLYGVPTEKGWVCLHLIDPGEGGSGASGCTRDSPRASTTG
jgi:hypothetical protein